MESQILTLSKETYFIIWPLLLSGGKLSEMLLQSKLNVFYYAEIINISLKGQHIKFYSDFPFLLAAG